MSTRHGRDTAVLSLSRPYHRKQHSLIRGATPPPANDPFRSRHRQQPSARKASWISARGRSPTKQPLEVVQPAKGALDNTGSAEVGAVFGLATGHLRCSVGSHVDAADAKPTPSRVQPCRRANWLWTAGVAGFYGGSTQVHLGAGPVVDPIHLAALRAALITGERLEITEPGYAEDYGREWTDPAALTEFGDREPTEPWTWAGPPRVVTGPTWGGCIEVIQWILTAGRFDADPAVLAGGVLLVESGEELITAREFGWILRSLGERGMLAAVDAVLVARPPASNLDRPRPSLDDRAAHRAAQRDVAVETIARYNPQAVVCVGIPFGHTRPQWILPYGGEVTVDGASHAVWADYR